LFFHRRRIRKVRGAPGSPPAVHDVRSGELVHRTYQAGLRLTEKCASSRQPVSTLDDRLRSSLLALLPAVGRADVGEWFDRRRRRPHWDRPGKEVVSRQSDVTPGPALALSKRRSCSRGSASTTSTRAFPKRRGSRERESSSARSSFLSTVTCTAGDAVTKRAGCESRAAPKPLREWREDRHRGAGWPACTSANRTSFTTILSSTCDLRHGASPPRNCIYPYRNLSGPRIQTKSALFKTIPASFLFRRRRPHSTRGGVPPRPGRRILNHQIAYFLSLPLADKRLRILVHTTGAPRPTGARTGIGEGVVLGIWLATAMSLASPLSAGKLTTS